MATLTLTVDDTIVARVRTGSTLTTDGTIGKLASKLLTVGKFLGLK